MPAITITDLVRNGTLNAEMAAVLWAAVDEQMSFLTVAIPRLAGKSTTSQAVLALRPDGMPAIQVAGEPEQMARLREAPRRGYLVVNEFSQAPIPGYIWGAPVRRVFETLPAGYALQASLHAPGVEAAVREVTAGNGVSDEQASAIKLVLYIERFGHDERSFWRRLVELYEVFEVAGGRPRGQTLFRWLPDADRFEQLAAPQQFGHDRGELARRAAAIASLAAAGRTGLDALREALAGSGEQR